MRYALPLLAAVVCLIVAGMVPPIVSFVLIMAALGFVLDVSTKLFENGRKAGGLSDHRQ